MFARLLYSSHPMSHMPITIRYCRVAMYRCLLRNIHLFSAIMLIAALITPAQTSAEVVDKVVAVVNDDIITLSELESEVSGLYQKLALKTSGQALLSAMEEAKEVTLDAMIEERLVQQRAKEARVTVSQKEIDEAYNKMMNKVGLNPEDFIEKLRASGMTEETYRDKLRTTILRSKLLSIDVRSKIVVTDEMMLDYYEQNYTSKVPEDKFYLLQMGFTWDDSLPENEVLTAKERAKETASRVRRLATSDQDFKDLAKQFSDLPSASDGGDIGIFTLEDMAEAMRDAVSKLKPGEISEVIVLGSSYQFFKLLSGDKNTIVTTSTYDSVKEEIREKLHNAKLKDAFEDWVKNLKDKAYIQKL